MEISFKTQRNMEKCVLCEYNPKNMTMKKRLKNWWSDLFNSLPSICGMCNAEKIINKLTPINRK